MPTKPDSKEHLRKIHLRQVTIKTMKEISLKHSIKLQIIRAFIRKVDFAALAELSIVQVKFMSATLKTEKDQAKAR